MSECRCAAVCTNPRGDEAVKALHALRHREFQAYLETRRDTRTFRPPSVTQLITRVSQEFDAPRFSTACGVHAGQPPHAAHSR